MAEFRADLADVVSRVQHGGEPVVIDRHGKPAVAVVPIEMLVRLQAAEDDADRKAARRSLREVAHEGHGLARRTEAATRTLGDAVRGAAGPTGRASAPQGT